MPVAPKDEKQFKALCAKVFNDKKFTCNTPEMVRRVVGTSDLDSLITGFESTLTADNFLKFVKGGM